MLPRYRKLVFSVCLIFCLINCSKETQLDTDPEAVELVEYTGFLKIPGVGFQTFFRFADEDLSLKQMPFSSGSAYFRWMWRQIEPVEGEYNWELIDQHLERARENGQTLEFRIMLEWPGEYNVGIPQWLVDKGVNMRLTNCENEDYFSPDMDDPVIKESHKKLIRALGNRYDGHPDLGSIDIGSVGLWGEWHEYCHPELMPSREERFSIIDLYYESFPNTPLVALVDDKESLEYAANKRRSAWRGDCWGNYLPEGSGWNHHINSYRPANNLIPLAWQNGPVALESCYTMKSWETANNAIATIIDDAINWHVSLAQNKSDYIPEEFKPDVERLVMKMGFRLVLRKVTTSRVVNPNTTMDISLDWDNIGIAPPYRDYRIALRLRDSSDRISGTYVSSQSVRGWLPGEHSVKIPYEVPKELRQGQYKLELGLLFHSEPDRIIPIAIEGITDDGWYVVGNIQME